VRCLDPRPELDPPIPSDAAETQQFIDYAAAVTAACSANSGDILPFVGTENVARDLDRIRAAVGDEKITYVGASYGTLIGELYADMFPTSIRAMILDGVVDPTLDFERFVIEQSAAFQGQIEKFLTACSADKSCAFHSRHTASSFRKLMARFADGPIDGVTAYVALYAVYLALLQNDTSTLAQELSLANRGITFPMAEAAGWTDDASLLDPYEAINCLDYAAPRDLDEFAAIAAEAADVAPDVGAWNTYTYFDCAFWPVPPSRTPHAVSAPGAPPILVLSATGDPATPHQWGVAVANQLSSGVLVTRVGGGHTSRSYPCVQAIAETYLITLTVPDAGTTCP
jgi:pimeloyl-ACP methyl ester carboxylesterase